VQTCHINDCFSRRLPRRRTQRLQGTEESGSKFQQWRRVVVVVVAAAAAAVVVVAAAEAAACDYDDIAVAAVEAVAAVAAVATAAAVAASAAFAAAAPRSCGRGRLFPCYLFCSFLRLPRPTIVFSCPFSSKFLTPSTVSKQDAALR